ncbi:vitamin B12-dependent ribonucleotide reductase [Lichenicoccus sp.]|uniref:TSCPD domain-containing protein n=1 Tax=Lichenicoccus sp. TaxID=2781899 RepID=UPI003D09BA1F
MRTQAASPDPDAAPRLVTVPADWDQDAAAAFAALAPGAGRASLAEASLVWVAPLADHPQASHGLAARLLELLLRRGAAPLECVWHGSRQGAPGFVLNLAAFAQPDSGFEIDGFMRALETLAEALHLLQPSGRTPCTLLLSNLDACLAALGLDYDSAPARAVAACLCALATSTMHPTTLASHSSRAAPAELPPHCPVPGLARYAISRWQEAEQRSRRSARSTPAHALLPETGPIETGLSAPGWTDALLGVEACGAAPLFSPLRQDGRLAASTLARLAARGMSPESALAASLAGLPVVAQAGAEAARAMHRAIAPFLDRQPAAPAEMQAPIRGTPTDRRRELPARRSGFTQKATVGGQAIYLRTGEYEDGRLGEVSIAPARASSGRSSPGGAGAVQRGLLDAVGQAVSLGLQHGVPLETYVETFAYARVGPGGAVEGDEAVASATSTLDYVFRTLAHAYLGRSLPDAPQQGAGPADDPDDALLPLDLPRETHRPSGPRRRHGLRLVG